MTSPTLFIVVGDDEDVLELNREAYDALECVKPLAVIEVRVTSSKARGT